MDSKAHPPEHLAVAHCAWREVAGADLLDDGSAFGLVQAGVLHRRGTLGRSHEPHEIRASLNSSRNEGVTPEPSPAVGRQRGAGESEAHDRHEGGHGEQLFGAHRASSLRGIVDLARPAGLVRPRELEWSTPVTFTYHQGAPFAGTARRKRKICERF